MNFLTALFFVFSSATAFAFECPQSIDITFGEVIENTIHRGYPSIENKTYHFVKRDLKKLCRYECSESSAKLNLVKRSGDSAEVVLNDYNSLQNLGYQFSQRLPLSVENGPLTLSLDEPRLFYYVMYMDQTGCEFGQVPCEAYPEEIGYIDLETMTLKLR